MTAPLAGSGAYERWVLTLRAWARDPEATSLDGLPELDEMSFSRETYARFVDHLLETMRQVGERWRAGLDRAWSRSVTPEELSRELIQLRIRLGRRLQLATHPGLPEPIRVALRRGFERDVREYQRQIEAGVMMQSSAATLDFASRDQMLALVRSHSFLAVLDYDVSRGRPQLPDLPEPVPQSQSPASPRVRRIVPFPGN